MMNNDPVEILLALFGLVPEVLLMAASILYVRKQPGLDSALMAVGSVLSVVLTLGWMIPNYLPIESGSDSSGREGYYSILGYSTTVAALLFMVGLFMLVLKQVPRASRPGQTISN
jgi:uncharacterized membrane protein YozB (DUF420 family)